MYTIATHSVRASTCMQFAAADTLASLSSRPTLSARRRHHDSLPKRPDVDVAYDRAPFTGYFNCCSFKTCLSTLVSGPYPTGLCSDNNYQAHGVSTYQTQASPDPG